MDRKHIVPQGGPLSYRRSRRTLRRWQHTGSEPATARSDLPARRMLARLFAPLFVCGAGGFAYLAATSKPGASPGTGLFVVMAAVCAVCAMIAVVDLYVIRRRMAEQRRWNR